MTASASRRHESERAMLTDDDFAIIANLAMRDFGLHLTLAKRELVYSRLLKRLNHLGIDQFCDYCRLVQSPNGVEERQEMLSALTTNVTHFFREGHHFQLLRETALPPLIEAARKGGKLRIWSAACSGGQEPYSLAFTVLDLCPEAARLNIRILATDVDNHILNRAQTGVYPVDELKTIPDYARKYLENKDKASFSIGAGARDLITFGNLNLIEAWPIKGPFDVIFCRNVAIYFDKPTQSRLWARFAELLTPDGHLCIGHSERVAGPAEQMLRPVGVTAYRRLAKAETVSAKSNPSSVQKEGTRS
ncbi:MAG: protein-glutamate O-methyltransferase CheR [Alphaproteobacteria bacterium]|jgi:chemotaxis protein methyltransferase CheR